MSITTKAFKGASWLAIFNLFSQIFSWVSTIIVARILVPGDYGLIELGTIMTGYAAMFSELGLGAAIVQRKDSNKNELSSVFWFSFGVSLFFSLSCFPLSYLTAYVFNEPRVIPLTQAASLIFVFSGLQIVPFNLLKKELDFKKVGIIQMFGVIVSCISMLIIARLEGGAWTLMMGMIIRSLTMMVLSYILVKWLPHFHYNFKEAIPYIKFGIASAVSRSLFYVYDKSDKFFAGRVWNPKTLGYYSFAMELSKLPTEKITLIINQVSFSVFSKLQDNKEEFNRFYLNIVKITMTLVLPLFVGGFATSEELVNLLLGEKWIQIIFIFKFLCLIQILTSLNAVNSFVHNAQGRPHWSVVYHATCAILMPLSFYFAVQYGLTAMLVPWFSTYFILCTVWIFITINKIGIDLKSYLRSIMTPLLATVIMLIPIAFVSYTINISLGKWNIYLISLILKVLLGAGFYLAYLWFFDRKLFSDIKKLRNV